MESIPKKDTLASKMPSSHHEPSFPHKRSRRNSSGSSSRRRNQRNEHDDTNGRLGGGGGGNSRHLLTTVALMASGAAMVIMSSSSTSTVGGGYSYGTGGGNLRFSRRLDTDADADADATATATATATAASTAVVPGSASPSISQTVQQLAQPFLDDKANIFAFDAADPRPVIHTFFAIPETLKIRKDDAETLAVWKQTWSALGWNPRILSIKDAESHPEYTDIDAKLKEVPLGATPDYDKACYLRHFAMAALGGGWMTDYDTVPLNMNAADYGREFPNYGKFTTFEGGTPSLIVGSGEEWDRVSKALLQEGMDAKNDGRGMKDDGKPLLFSDMFALEALIEKEEVNVFHPSFNPQAVFQLHEDWITKATEIMDWDFQPNRALQEHCDNMKEVMALHFSHSSISNIGFLYARPLLVAEYLDRWSKLCGGPNYGLGDSSKVSATADSTLLYGSDKEMAISRENSLVYVSVPQTGGVHFIFSGIFADALDHHPIGGVRSIGEMTMHAERRGISDFTKAAHIRHPCNRFIDAFELMTSDRANEGDKRWTKQHIGDKSIDDFVAEIEKNPEELLLEAHFFPMWQWLFNTDGTYGLDVTMCYETWSDSLDKLNNDFNVPVPDTLKSYEAETNKPSKCQDLRPETIAAIERIYHMDYCIFGYDALPQKSCPQHDLTAEEITQKYYACAAPPQEPPATVKSQR